MRVQGVWLIIPLIVASMGGAAPRLEAAPRARKAATSAEGDEARTQAKALFAEGGRKYRAGRLREAIAIFEKAYALWENPAILVNIAIALLESGDKLKAVRTLRRALAQSSAERAAGIRDKLPKALASANEEAVELRVEMPEPAEVEVDGALEGTTPVTLVLMPGSHEVVIKVAGQEKLRKTFTLGPASRSESFSLTAWPGVAAPVEDEPPPKEEPSKGPGFWKRLRSLQTLPIWYFGAAAALALVGGATLVGTGVKTSSLEDDFQSNPTHSTRDEGIRYRTATNVMVGITVTALVGSAVLALFTDWRNPFKKRERQVELAPQVGQGGGGLVLTGQF